jgi:endonuclease/exonuclease/phosphatase family metal-dependent hydrolase
MPRTTRRRRFVAFIVIALILSVLAPGSAIAKDKRELDVMTRNLYLGSSLTPAIGAQDPAEFLLAVAGIWGTVQFTDFTTRAEAVADEIVATTPDLIGLQEVSLWETTGPALPGIDFLEVLLAALHARGLDYSVAAVSTNAVIGPVPLVLCADPVIGACTLQFTDRDVILVNETTGGLEIGDAASGLYETQAVLSTPVGPLSFDRGWAYVDGTFEGKKFRFANTHLETEDFPAVQEAQAREFLAGPAKTGGAVIAVGDFNSAADGSTTASYSILTKAYFDDAWDLNSGDPGLTCCQNGTLTNPTSELQTRIDLVLTHAASRALSAEVVGATPFQATPPFWASDHAGVVATIRIH